MNEHIHINNDHFEIEEKDILHFPEGLPGFEKSKRFLLVINEEHLPFSYLQSVDEPELTFLIIDPFSFFPNYEFDLPDTDAKDLQLDSSKPLLIRSIVSIREGLETATANLVAPIVLNAQTRIGRQVILPSTDYTTRHRLFPSNAER